MNINMVIKINQRVNEIYIDCYKSIFTFCRNEMEKEHQMGLLLPNQMPPWGALFLQISPLITALVFP